ncbi:MAG: GNAT family N-acetyltransferase [Erythrobacter sp.]|uniref:GNAT family N-acetyltransferase n=1 Tax=Erythrobacter sp. TaxID=1042 RepID=UPI0025EAAF1D|nr:GNAT family N-acetyltransferase [Erythrobacter sp.]MCM0000861.1 GNAT family N-acetyltransferase [Erythrobacter sp.]
MSLIDPISVPPEGLRDCRVAAGLHRDLTPAAGNERLRAELLRADHLALPDHQRWAALSREAAPGNIFAADWLMAPAMAHAGQRLRLAVAAGAAGVWLGALPLGLGRLGPRSPVPVLRSWHCPVGGIGTPLLRPGAERAFWAALLARLDRRPGIAAGLIAQALPLDDPATLALAHLCTEQGRLLHRGKSIIRRARIAGRPGSPRKGLVFERRLEQLEARLADRLGPVRLVLHRRAGDCAPWLAAFLALERGAGIARAGPEPFRTAIRAGHSRGAVRLVSLSAGERVVAMSGWLVADRRGWGLACAYDTRLAAYAPQRLLMRRVTALAALEGLTRFDGSVGSDPGSDALWPEARAFADFAVAIGGPARRALFDRAMGARSA